MRGRAEDLGAPASCRLVFLTGFRRTKRGLINRSFSRVPRRQDAGAPRGMLTDSPAIFDRQTKGAEDIVERPERPRQSNPVPLVDARVTEGL